MSAQPLGFSLNPRILPLRHGRVFDRSGRGLFDATAKLAMLLVVSCSGCNWDRPLARPPGTIEQQRFSASMHDPYADNDAGPEVVGGRPRDFEVPRDEATRSRAHPASSGSTSWWNSWFGR